MPANRRYYAKKVKLATVRSHLYDLVTDPDSPAHVRVSAGAALLRFPPEDAGETSVGVAELSAALREWNNAKEGE